MAYFEGMGGKNEPQLIGTYNSNRSIDVSAYGADSVNQFMVKVTSVAFSAGCTAGGTTQRVNTVLGMGKFSFNPSMTLSSNGNTLTLSGITYTGSYNVNYTDEWGHASHKTMSGNCTLTVQLYFVG